MLTFYMKSKSKEKTFWYITKGDTTSENCKNHQIYLGSLTFNDVIVETDLTVAFSTFRGIFTVQSLYSKIPL